MFEIRYEIEWITDTRLGTGLDAAGVDDVIDSENGLPVVRGWRVKSALEEMLAAVGSGVPGAMPNGSHLCSRHADGGASSGGPQCPLCDLFGVVGAVDGSPLHFGSARLRDGMRGFLQALLRPSGGDAEPVEQDARAFIRAAASSALRRPVRSNRIDPFTGVADNQAFFSLEYGARVLPLRGVVRQTRPLSDMWAGARAVELLRTGLHLIDSIGGRRSRGGGHCLVTVMS